MRYLIRYASASIVISLLLVFTFWILKPLNGFAQDNLSNSQTARPKNASCATYKLNLKPKKPAIDSTALKNWVSLDKENVAISSDGKFFMYNIMNRPVNSNTLVIQSIDATWRKELIAVPKGFFSGDNKSFVYQKDDTLSILALGTNEIEIKPSVIRFIVPKSGEGKWLLYQLKSPSNHLVLRNLFAKSERHFDSVTNYSFDESGRMLLWETTKQVNGRDQTNLQYLNLEQETSKNIWTSKISTKGSSNLMSYCIDKNGHQIIFLIQNSSYSLNGSLEVNYSIWYYKVGMSTAVMKVHNQTAGVPKDFLINEMSSPCFSNDGRYIFFLLYPNENRQLDPNASGVDVWSYKDKVLQSVQLKKIAANEQIKTLYTISIEAENDILNAEVVCLTKVDEEPYLNYPDVSGDFLVVRDKRSGDKFWEFEEIYYLVSLKDGSRRQLATIHEGSCYFWLSPGGKYLLQYQNDHNFYSLDLKTGKKINISKTVPTSLTATSSHHQGFRFETPVGIAGWGGMDSAVLVYDNHDVWSLDLKGEQRPINVSRSYGILNNCKIRLVNEGNIYHEGDSILLTVFNSATKYNGIWPVTLRKQSNGGTPVMKPWTLYYKTGTSQAWAGMSFDGGMRPLKAKNANMWIVKMQSAREAPNYFFTNNFRNFSALTELKPQSEYNWLTAELIHWKLPDGTQAEGILYKPENFDARKKYPVIVHYYEWFSGGVHQYPIPGFTRATHPNIAWFVSQGYLVFRPDIYLTNRKIAESACNSIISGVKWLTHFPYVDSKRIGISGFSWGGHLTNWLISRTNMFAAAATGGGGSDEISKALQLSQIRGQYGGDQLAGCEYLVGATIWERPDLWLNISPVMHANKVTTPLLILYNQGDDGWQQGAELYIALRRLDKKVWMLQYDDQAHAVDGKASEDFTIRITQFFDYYLRGALAPRWMTRGIPARLKGIETGYELDMPGATP